MIDFTRIPVVNVSDKVDFSDLRSRPQIIPSGEIREGHFFKEGDIIALQKEGSSICHPALARCNGDENIIVVRTVYCFKFHEAYLAVTHLKGTIRREGWSMSRNVRWIRRGKRRDRRGPLWYNTGDGYLPWFPNEDDVLATDWGILEYTINP